MRRSSLSKGPCRMKKECARAREERKLRERLKTDWSRDGLKICKDWEVSEEISVVSAGFKSLAIEAWRHGE